jgi:hypothetical protein
MPTSTSPLAAALEAIDLHASDPLHRAKCRGLMVGYDSLYRNHRYTVTGVEDTVTAPLINVETQRASRTFMLAGKLDVRVVHEGRNGIIDHKTTSEDVTQPDSMYWRQLIVESQPSHYMLLEWMNSRKVDFCVWDVVRKPAIRQAQIDKKDREAMMTTGQYCGYKLTTQDWAEYDEQTQRTGKHSETHALYEARLAQDCTLIRPDWYFRHREVPRLDADLIEYAREVWEHAEEIRIATAAGRHPRSSGSCIQYHQPCRFLGICSGYDSPESAAWRTKAWVHAELPIMDGDGKQYLTNSRIRNFQSCRRRHQYDYLIGIERDEDRDALIFGSLWHEAQAAWWGAQMQQNTESLSLEEKWATQPK